LLDAVAVSQATPGPFSTVATFIGYLLAGWKGAGLATVGMFLPAFVYVGATSGFLPRLRKSPLASAFLDGVNAAAVALMAFVGWQFGRAALVNLPAVVLAFVSGVLVFRYKLNSTWLVLGGAVAGILISAFWLAVSSADSNTVSLLPGFLIVGRSPTAHSRGGLPSFAPPALSGLSGN